MALSMISSLIAIILPLVIMPLSYILSAKALISREKKSPFECGFDPKKTARLPFSTRFFLLAMIFLVFDIEIVLIMPAPMALMSNMYVPFIISSSLFLLILLFGLIHEWREGSLNWVN